MKAVANHELICSWLGLSPEEWPPNHYALLGLPVGEPDLERIQQRIHERMAKVRPYQVKHPEQVTEAMNRIAQAYTVLTDMSSKRAYDAKLLGQAAPPPERGELSAAEQIRAAVAEHEKGVPALVQEGGDPLAWLFTSSTPPAAAAAPAVPVQADWKQAPPQIQADWREAPPPAQVEPAPSPPVQAPPLAVEELPASPEEVEVPEPVAPAPPAPPATPAPPPVDPILEAAQLSPAARRGLSTRRGLYRRIQRTRHLLAAWRQVGSFLNQPKRRLTKAADAAELTAQLNAILEILEGFPAILGGAGQPGNYIVTLAQLPTFIPSFRALSLSQREELARDWRAGRDLLLAHEEFLAREVRAFRKIGHWGRFVRATKALYADHPGLFLLFVSLMTLLIAVVALRRWRG